MITVRFLKSGERYRSFTVSGHARYADKGQDIVCAAVTSSVQLVVNTAVDVMGLPAQTTVEENCIAFFPQTGAPAAQQLIEGLYRHLLLLSEDYPQNVRIEVSQTNA